MLLQKNRTRIEAAFDFGRVEALHNGEPVASRPLAEAELELVSGAPKALFKIARLCLEESEGRLKLAAASKEEQARRLLEDDPWLAPEAPLHLDEKATAGDALAAALLSTGLRLIEIAPAATDFRLPEGAHQMRVALRRLRAVEKVFRDAVDSRELRNLARRAGRFAAALGPARDWDVFLEETMPHARARAGRGEGFRGLEARAEALRAKAWDKAARKISGAAFQQIPPRSCRRILLAVLAGGRGARSSKSRRHFAAKALDERLETARGASRSGRIAPAERHPLRIALKKLRIRRANFPLALSARGKARLHDGDGAAQDALGALNDAVIAQELSNSRREGRGGRGRARGRVHLRVSRGGSRGRFAARSLKAGPRSTPCGLSGER